MESYTEKTCPKCGTGFRCYNKGVQSCWCENYTLFPETLKYLQQTYSNCLCEDCLGIFSAKKGE